jgi:hypothetical protein
MCGACAVLGSAPDWVDRVGNPDGIGHDQDMTRGAERQRRVRLVNLLLRPTYIKLVDLGSQLSLQSPTGRIELVEGLAHVWAAADRLSSIPVDPLDPLQIDSIERRSSGGSE